MRRLAISLAALCALSAGAQAQSEQQRNALFQIADATLVDERCPSLALNETVVGMIALAFQLKGENLNRFEPVVSARLAENYPVVQAMDEETACRKGTELFGPTGTNVPNLLLKSDH